MALLTDATVIVEAGGRCGALLQGWEALRFGRLDRHRNGILSASSEAVAARRDAGFNLDFVQRGLDPENWRPMKTVGAGVNEIRVRDATGAYRVIYLATRPEAIYVLHCFQKKTEKTSQHDIDLAKKRFKAIPKSTRK